MHLAGTILPIFAIILAGWLAGVCGYLSRELAAPLMRFAYYVAMPALVFLTIADEYAQLGTDRPFGKAKGTTAVLRFTPDPKYGFPRSYRRDVVGATLPVAIDVVRFVPDPPRAKPSL